jgi:hypothetical protein
LADIAEVMPTGGMHLVFRLSEEPLRLFREETDSVGQTMSHAMVGGARSMYYERDVSRVAASVGVLLQPGASELLFGVPARRKTPASKPFRQRRCSVVMMK